MDTDYRLFVPLDLFKTLYDIEHACIIILMADIMTRTLLFPLTISDWYTTKKTGSSLFCIGKMGTHSAKWGIDAEELSGIKYGE